MFTFAFLFIGLPILVLLLVFLLGKPRRRFQQFLGTDWEITVRNDLTPDGQLHQFADPRFIGSDLSCRICGHRFLDHGPDPTTHCRVEGCSCTLYRDRGEDVSRIVNSLDAIRNARPEAAEATTEVFDTSAISGALEEARQHGTVEHFLGDISQVLADYTRREMLAESGQLDLVGLENALPQQPGVAGLVVLGAYELETVGGESVGQFVPGVGPVPYFSEHQVDYIVRTRGGGRLSELLSWVSTRPQPRPSAGDVAEFLAAYLQEQLRPLIGRLCDDTLIAEINRVIAGAASALRNDVWNTALMNGTGPHQSEDAANEQCAAALDMRRLTETVQYPGPRFEERASQSLSQAQESLLQAGRHRRLRNEEYWRQFMLGRGPAEPPAAPLLSEAFVTSLAEAGIVVSELDEQTAQEVLRDGPADAVININPAVIQEFNNTVFDALSTPGLEQQAADAVNDFTRTTLRESGVSRRIMPPPAVSDDGLDRQVDTDRPLPDSDAWRQVYALDRSISSEAWRRASHLAREVLSRVPVWEEALTTVRDLVAAEAAPGTRNAVDFDLVVNRMLCQRCLDTERSPITVLEEARNMAAQVVQMTVHQESLFLRELRRDDAILHDWTRECLRQMANVRAEELLDLFERDRVAYNSELIRLGQAGNTWQECLRQQLAECANRRGGEWMEQHRWGEISQDSNPLRFAAHARHLAVQLLEVSLAVRGGRLAEMRDQHPELCEAVEQNILRVEAERVAAGRLADDSPEATFVEVSTVLRPADRLATPAPQQQSEVPAIGQPFGDAPVSVPGELPTADRIRGSRYWVQFDRIATDEGLNTPAGVVPPGPRVLNHVGTAELDRLMKQRALLQFGQLRREVDEKRAREDTGSTAEGAAGRLHDLRAYTERLRQEMLDRLVSDAGIPPSVYQGSAAPASNEPAGASTGQVTAARIREAINHFRAAAENTSVEPVILLNRQTYNDVMRWANANADHVGGGGPILPCDRVHMYGAQLIIVDAVPDGQVRAIRREDGDQRSREGAGGDNMAGDV